MNKLDTTEPRVFITIDQEDFSRMTDIYKKFKLSMAKFYNMLAKNHFGFIDGYGIPHKIDRIDSLFLKALKLEKNRKGDQLPKRIKLLCQMNNDGTSTKSELLNL